MAFNDDMTWDDLTRLAQRHTRTIRDAVKLMGEDYQQWLAFRDARSDATIATAQGDGTTTAQVTLVRLAYEALGAVYDFADNVASPTQGNRLGALRDLIATEQDASQKRLVQNGRSDANRALHAILEGQKQYEDWLNFRDGRNDATIATALSVAEADVTALRLAYKAMGDVFDFANNVASPVQGDRIDAWELFT